MIYLYFFQSTSTKVEIPVENLRRSSRANKGQRTIDPGTILIEEESPRKKRPMKEPKAVIEEKEEETEVSIDLLEAFVCKIVNLNGKCNIKYKRTRHQ